ncbi:MAG: glycosyltransferase [Actinophytocola sp.]|uniref:glycosyltransferase n=1 Tax=Actinophytocola sp. TaxID=1872138 RepID=UPI003C740B67
MSPLNILIVGLNYTPEHAGIAPYTTGTARGLAAEGHRVRVVTGFPYYPQWTTAPGYRGWRAGLARHERDGDVDLLRLRHFVPSDSTGVGRMVHEASFAAHTLAHTLRRRPDVVLGVSPSLLSVGAARLAARRFSVPFGVIVQDIYAESAAEVGSLGGRGGAAVLRLERGLLLAADGVVVVHEQFRDTLVGRHGVDPERVEVIRNWTHIRPPGGDRERVRAELGWPADQVVALHAGNMGAKQELGNVVAAARLAGGRDRVHFVLLGDGSRRASVVADARDVTAVSVLDPVAEARFPDVLAAADVLLVNERPGLHTMSVPSKLTSYFLVGRPVVAASEPDSPASRELARSGAGVRVPPGEPGALLDAVRAIGTDPRRRAELGDRGTRYAREKLTERGAIERYARWVTRLAAGDTP